MTSAPSHTPAYGEVDLASCESEPIHIPGAIQPHGVLIALDEDRTVATISVNSEAMLGTDHGDALGAHLGSIVGEQADAAIAERIADWAPGEPLIQWLPEDLGGLLAGEAVDITLHRSGDRILVEIETWSRPRSTMLTYQSARAAMARLAARTSLEGMLEQLAWEVRDLTLFDRVMIYRFDRQWNGEVVAEERRQDLNPYLGLHYPATDIPEQARRLYLVNWTRLIADVDYRPVHLDPVLDPATGQPLDLTHSTLRSVSPIHIEYLANMGVTSSMSISLIVDGELWGLVACHHYSGPHRPSQDARAAAEFLGQVASQQISDLERAGAREDALAAQEGLARISARIAGSQRSPVETLVEDTEMLSLVGATGSALYRGGRLLTRGDVPDSDSLHRIAEALLGTQGWGEPHASDHLAQLDPRLESIAAQAAGALGIGTGGESWVLWLRPELPQVVDWGGDPRNKEVYAGPAGKARISPRKSFDLWQEVIRGYSLPWASWQLGVVRDIRTFMNAHLLQRSREQILVAESLQLSVLPAVAPEFDGVDVAVRYVSASTYQLGGDWYDAFRLGDGRLAFVVGDVAGHGVAAVAAMTQVRAALRAHLFAGESPDHSLDLLDELMVHLMDDQVATAIVAVVDPAALTVELASAGHPPAVVFSGAGGLPLDIPSRPLLGLGVRGAQASTVVDLRPASTLVLYTDGLIERRGQDFSQSLERLAEVGGSAPTATELTAWVDRLITQCDGAGDDDRTVVAIRVADALPRVEVGPVGLEPTT